MENCNCNKEYNELHKENVMFELDLIFQKLKCADWAKIYGNIHNNRELMNELSMLKHNILWEDLKGCIYHNKDLMKLFDDMKHNISWSDINGDVALSKTLIDKIKELIVDALEGDKFNEELLKRVLALFKEISQDLGAGEIQNEIYKAFTDVINRYFKNEEHIDDSKLYKAIIIGLTHLLYNWLEGKDKEAVDLFLERLILALLRFFGLEKGKKYLKQLWNLLLDFLVANPDMTEKLWNILLDYLVKYPDMAKKLWKILLDYLLTDDDLAKRLLTILLDFLKKFKDLQKKLLDILIEYLDGDKSELDKLLNILLARLKELLKNDPDNPLIQFFIDLIKEILSKLKLGDLGDVEIENISAGDKYEYHLTYNKDNQKWVSTPHAWYGPKSLLPTNRIFGVLYYVSD